MFLALLILTPGEAAIRDGKPSLVASQRRTLY
jgi:hypothetical protein